MTEKDKTNNDFPILKIVQLVFGGICFALYYLYCTKISSVFHTIAPQYTAFFVMDTFAITAITGYPFIIILTIIIAFKIAGTSEAMNVLCLLLDIIGFGMYLAIGIVLANFCVRTPSAEPPVKAMAAMCILTGLLFLCDVIGDFMMKHRNTDTVKKVVLKTYSLTI